MRARPTEGLLATRPGRPLVFPPMIKQIMSSWDKLAQDDPLWAILTHDERAGGAWNEDEFFATGVADVSAVLARLEQLHEMPALTRALDFGCGVGRLTRALAQCFIAADGVDVSRVMIERAVARQPGSANLRFLHNPRADLARLKGTEYSFILSLISLQHMPEKVALRYIDDMCGLLMPGGVAYLQVSTHLDTNHPPSLAKLGRDESRVNRIYRALRQALDPRHIRRMDTFYCRLSRITEILERRRMKLVAVLPDASVPHPFVSHVVVFKKPAAG